MTSTGAQYLAALLSGDYQLLWFATPADWYVRLPGRAGPHYQRIQNLMSKARALRMTIVLVVSPGNFWRQGPTASNATARTSCPADQTCKWRLRARASLPIHGDAHAT
eukprot:4761526-Pyramimonas_sp.AAC.1